MDRTGMLMGSYYMNYLGWSYNETVWYNYAVSDRPQARGRLGNVSFFALSVCPARVCGGVRCSFL